MEQHEQRTCFNLIGLGDAAECLGEGGQVARELRADAAVGKEGALLQEFLVHLVGGGGAKAECLHERFRVQAAGTVDSFRCGERDAGFFVEVADHGVTHVCSLLFQSVVHHGAHDAVLDADPHVVSLEVEFIERAAVLTYKVCGTDERAVCLVVRVENAQQVGLRLLLVANRLETQQTEIRVGEHRVGEYIVAVVCNLCVPAGGECVLALGGEPCLFEAAEFVLRKFYVARDFAGVEPFVDGREGGLHVGTVDDERFLDSVGELR